MTRLTLCVSWAIRNCGLMLFRSLIDRLLGAAEPSKDGLATTAKASRLSYDRYPGLIDLLVELLSDRNSRSVSSGTESSEDLIHQQRDTERIFPVLEMLRRAAPPSDYQGVVKKLLLQAVGSQNWHLRDMTAKTYAAVTHEQGVASVMQSLSKSNAGTMQNARHGYLLVIKHLVRRVNLTTGAEALHLLGGESQSTA